MTNKELIDFVNNNCRYCNPDDKEVIEMQDCKNCGYLKKTMSNEIENGMEEYYKECDLRTGKLENDSDVPVSNCSFCFRYETCKNYYNKVNSAK